MFCVQKISQHSKWLPYIIVKHRFVSNQTKDLRKNIKCFKWKVSTLFFFKVYLMTMIVLLASFSGSKSITKLLAFEII